MPFLLYPVSIEDTVVNLQSRISKYAAINTLQICKLVEPQPNQITCKTGAG